jgi:hypothetical protein
MAYNPWKSWRGTRGSSLLRYACMRCFTLKKKEPPSVEDESAQGRQRPREDCSPAGPHHRREWGGVMQDLRAARSRAGAARALRPGAGRGGGPRVRRAPGHHARLSAWRCGWHAEDRRRRPTSASPPSPGAGGTGSLAGVAPWGEDPCPAQTPHRGEVCGREVATRYGSGRRKGLRPMCALSKGDESPDRSLEPSV